MARNIVLYALTLALLAVGYLAHSASKELDQAVATVETLQGQIISKQAEIELLTHAVTVSSDALQLVKDERGLVIQLHKEQLASNQLVAAELAKNQAHVNQLRQSTDEYVKAWSATHMPGAAVRLLQYAEYTGNYPNGGAADAGVSDTAGKFAGRLSAKQHF